MVAYIVSDSRKKIWDLLSIIRNDNNNNTNNSKDQLQPKLQNRYKFQYIYLLQKATTYYKRIGPDSEGEYIYIFPQSEKQYLVLYRKEI